MLFHRYWKALALFLAALLVLAGCGGGSGSGLPPDPTPTTPQTTTLMVYMVGSDLESRDGQATANLKEMLAATRSGDVNIVLTTGGAVKTDPAGLVKDWRTLKRHVIRNGQLQELADLGAVSMSQPGTLRDFVVWARNQFPADRYMIAFWNHGGGDTGFGQDDIARGWMRMPLIAQGLEGARQATGLKFDVIAFDACLMATAEVAMTLAPHGRYLVASQELEPGSGWDWKALVSALGSNPDLPTVDFAKTLAASYLAKQKAEGDKVRQQYPLLYTDDYYTTVSVTDLSRAQPVVAALEAFAPQLQQYIGTDQTRWMAVAQLRALSASYGGGGLNNGGDTDLVDAIDFLSRLKAQGIVPQAAQAVIDAVRQAVLLTSNGRLAAGSNGLSLYFPWRQMSTRKLDDYYDQYAFLPAYRQLLRSYIGLPSGNPGIIGLVNDPAAAPNLLVNVNSTYGVESAHVLLGQEDPATQKIRIFGAVPIRVQGGYSAVSQAFDGTWLTLNGHTVPMIWVKHEGVDEDGDPTAEQVAIPVRINGELSNILLRHEFASNTWSVIGSWDGNENGLPDRTGNPIEPTDQISTLAIIYDRNTRDIEVDAAPQQTFAAGALAVAATPLPSGTHQLFIMVDDYADNDNVSAAFVRVVP